MVSQTLLGKDFMKKTNFFTCHLSEAGENYFEHFLFTFTTALWTTVVSFILFCHAFFPFLFTFTASNNVKKIDQIMQKRVQMLMERKRKAAEESSEQGF